jgi:anti-sigma factor RsiW
MLGRKAAAIVYKRREHVINLLFRSGSGSSPPESRDVDGYHLVRWSRDGLTYRAVSDLEAGELRAFADAARAQ